MLYICIPSHDEASTIGVLLWRIRKVFQGYSREYEIIVYDDASSDGTQEILAPYAEVAPLTIIRGETRKGYGAALEALVREASRRTKYPRRDAMIVMQGDFTDQPENLPDLIKRFEGGSDIVLVERGVAGQPAEVRRLRQWARWIERVTGSISGVADPYGTFRLYRISLLRDLIKSSGEKPLVASSGWTANLELLRATLPLARRVEIVKLESRYDLRVRPTRISPFADAMNLFRFARSVRGRRVALPGQQPPEKSSAVPRNSTARERVSS